jgi:subtilisin family serine protease
MVYRGMKRSATSAIESPRDLTIMQSPSVLMLRITLVHLVIVIAGCLWPTMSRGQALPVPALAPRPVVVAQGQERQFLETPLTTPLINPDNSDEILVSFDPDTRDFDQAVAETLKDLPGFEEVKERRNVRARAVLLRPKSTQARLAESAMAFSRSSIATTPFVTPQSSATPSNLVLHAETMARGAESAVQATNKLKELKEEIWSPAQVTATATAPAGVGAAGVSRFARPGRSFSRRSLGQNVLVRIPPPPAPPKPLVSAYSLAAMAGSPSATVAASRGQGFLPNATALAEGRLWGLTNIRAQLAWTKEVKDLNPIPVAVLDTGINLNHPDLIENISSNRYNLVPNSGAATSGQGTDVDDRNGHGTHVSGTIGAVGRDSPGYFPSTVVGVNWNIKLVPVRFLDDQGYAPVFNALDAITAAYTAADADKSKKLVINMSWGIWLPSPPLYLKTLIDLYQDQVLFVAAAGNAPAGQPGSNNDAYPIYPASFSKECLNLISVMAVDRCDRVAYYSNYGVVSVDIAAPGGMSVQEFPDEDIYSTWINDPNGRGNFATAAGTSMASAYVSGAAALVWAKHPDWKPSQVKAMLLARGREPHSPGGANPLARKCRSERVLDLLFLRELNRDDDVPKLPGEMDTCPPLVLSGDAKPFLAELDLSYSQASAFTPPCPLSPYIPTYSPIWPPRSMGAIGPSFSATYSVPAYSWSGVASWNGPTPNPTSWNQTGTPSLDCRCKR